MTTQTTTDMTTVQHIKEEAYLKRTEFVVLKDATVPPMDREEVLAATKTKLPLSIEEEKGLGELHDFLTQKELVLHKGWRVGFRWKVVYGAMSEHFYFQLVIGPADKAGRFRNKVYEVGLIPPFLAKSVIELVRKWLHKSMPTK